MAAKRIVVKIGSSSLTNTHGEIDQQQLEDHVHALALLHQNNMEVILVSSGAIAAGFKQLGYSSRPVTQKGKQAAAAVGRGLLIQTYMEKLKEYDITAAQILLTRSDFSDQGDIEMLMRQWKNCWSGGSSRLSMKMIRLPLTSLRLEITICFLH